MKNGFLSPLMIRALRRLGFPGLLAVLLAPLAHATTITDDDYEGRSQFKIVTANATWFYDKSGGAFSRMIDGEGRDWIAFHKDPLDVNATSAAAGWRGVPMLLGDHVPIDPTAGCTGYDMCTSTLLPGNVIHTVSKSGQWAWHWSFTDTHAIFTMEKAPDSEPWWFMYQGPTGGKFSPLTSFWGTSDGGPRWDTPDHKGHREEVSGHWRWVYFGGVGCKYTLLVAQIQPDATEATFSYFGNHRATGVHSLDGMTLFGFGRGLAMHPELHGAGHSFVIGFAEGSAFDASYQVDPAFHEKMASAVGPWIDGK